MDIGQYIKQLRIQHNLTQEELGARIGVQRAAVQKWESGLTQNLKRTTLLELSKIFDVPAASFVSTDEDKKEKPIPLNTDEFINPLDAQFTKLLQNMSDDQKKLLIAQMKFLMQDRDK